MEQIYGMENNTGASSDFSTKTGVLIATPTYDSKVNVSYMMALIETIRLLEAEGFAVDVQIPSNSALVVHSRNAILQRFMELNGDYLLMVDSDLAWDPKAVLNLIKTQKEFCGGVYPDRNQRGFLFKPVLREEDNSICVCEQTGLLKMEQIPAGFMLLKRSAIEKMQFQFPELKYKSEIVADDRGYCLFNTEVWDGKFWGEDYVFCHRAREAGIDIWIDPTIEFSHCGIYGKLMDILTTNQDEALTDNHHSLAAVEIQ